MGRKIRTLALAASLACVAGQAEALDVDQIEVRSRIGEPLVADIPIVSGDPAELRNVQAQLASAITFARVGLARPHGVVADLHFAVVKDARGKPVIRVTSSAPVQEDFFTFLVEVDWGAGRLVREYSVALNNPGALPAALPPPIQAPAAASSNLIQRPSQPVPIPLAGDGAATPPSPAPASAEAAPAEPAPVPIPLTSTSRPTRRPPAPAAAVDTQPRDGTAVPKPEPKPEPKPTTPVAARPTPSAAKPAPKPAASTPPATERPVASAPPSPSSPPPTAKAAAGDYAVKAGDNLARIAARLGSNGYSRDQTMLALLRANPDAFTGGNINRLRQGAVLQAPTGAELARFGAAEAAQMVSEQVRQWRTGGVAAAQPVALAGAAAPAPRPSSTAPAATANGARLEIVPSLAGSGANTRSGIAAGGKGDAMRKALDETRETLAARDVELDELRRRVAGLEKIQQDQQKLIALQGNALASAQRNLGEKQRDDAVGGRHPRAPSWPWWLGGAVALALLTWLAIRGRRPEPVASRTFDTETLADALPPRTDDVDTAPLAAAPTWHGPAARDAAIDADIAALDPDSDGCKRLRLAQAHLDLGDGDAARPILRQVAAADDAAAAGLADRLLRTSAIDDR